MNIIADLQWRGLIHQTTGESELADLLSTPTRFFVGFDPTASSLHVGSLQQLLLARRLQLAGHKPVLLVGGGTGLIGDPKPTTERALSSKEQVAEWAEAIRKQVSRFINDDTGLVLDNGEWLHPLSALDFLRDVGKHFTLNVMLSKDIVASRLDSGISFTEFSFMLLQGLDFLELFKRHDVRLQLGGSDQWGNMVSGTDLIRRTLGERAHAMTSPLLLKADGTKFGKTESGTVWLDPTLTTPFEFHQFWLNQEDSQVSKLLRVFSFESRERIEELERLTVDQPWLRAAQRHLAEEITTLVHGAEAARNALVAGEALFSGKVEDLSAEAAAMLVQELKAVTVSLKTATVLDLALAAGVVSSKNEARRALKEGSLKLQGRTVREETLPEDLTPIHGAVFVGRGKRSRGAVRIAS